ncbi:uncharacterized protein EMH_0091630 [Eimeria mitis]|uniref:Uncharacterized protein n=1 Tax=Eimeria mitis TaxID=44415 RepID=U6KGQ5_9EIME|nr:uncharacterized protein EMH_0091630 [Eimeria mitis]CDJ34643.1 hypothetical protein EMH_0091630 [Eimeria mitis]
MAPSEQFWQLLLGEELTSGFSTRGSAQGCRKDGVMQLREFGQTDGKLELQGTAAHLTAPSEQVYTKQKTQLDIAKSLGVDELLQMTSDDLCRQPISSLSATLAEMEHCIQPLHSCLKLLDLPSLVLKCSNGGLYDEAVDVMMLADEMKEARSSCVKTMLRQLGQHAQLSPSMKLIGPLRRLSCSEEQLRMQYLRRREGEISRQRRNAEGSCETDPAQ